MCWLPLDWGSSSASDGDVFGRRKRFDIGSGMFGQPTSPRFRAALAGTLTADWSSASAACGKLQGLRRWHVDEIHQRRRSIARPIHQYGDLKGKTISIYTGIVTPEDTPQKDSYKPFEKCTGVTVQYEGGQVVRDAESWSALKRVTPPDLAIVPQPGLLKQLVATGKAVVAPDEVAANVDKFWGADWKAYATVDGKFYGAPMGASVKFAGLVFAQGVSPTAATRSRPRSTSSRRSATRWSPPRRSRGARASAAATPGLAGHRLDGKTSCSGCTGRTCTTSGSTTRSRSNGPESTAALDAVGGYLEEPAVRNGGLGRRQEHSRPTAFQDGGLPILEGNCEMHRQASFYAANWPKGTRWPPTATVFGVLPAPAGRRQQAGARRRRVVVAFADRPEVKAFQTYLSTDTWANTKGQAVLRLGQRETRASTPTT